MLSHEHSRLPLVLHRLVLALDLKVNELFNSLYLIHNKGGHQAAPSQLIPSTSDVTEQAVKPAV